MIEPTERLLWALGAVAFLGLVSASIPVLNLAAPVFGLGLLGLVLIDAGWAKSPRRVRVRRELPGLVAGQDGQAHFVLEADAPVTVALTDTWPGFASPYVTVEVALVPGEIARVPFVVRAPRRGRFVLGHVAVRTLGPLGLVRRRVRQVVPDVAGVGPDLVTLERQAVRTLRGQNAAGRARRAPKAGRAFAMLREYRRGDDVRQVAWKASAKRQQLVVKQTEPERHQDVIIALDCGRQMFGQAEAETLSRPRLDIAVDAALSLAAACVELSDRPGLSAFAQQVLAHCPPGAGRRHFARLGDITAPLEAGAAEPDYVAWAAQLMRHQKRRALVCLITDLTDVTTARTLLRAVARLRGTHLVWVCALSDPALLRATHDDDPLVRRAAARVTGHRQKALAAVRALGALVSDAPAPQLSSHIVNAYRDIKQQGRL